MSLPAPARFALMLGEPAWQRAAFDAHCALVDGVVQLAWDSRFEGTGGAALPVGDLAGAGLVFDTQCRLYQSLPAGQRVQRWLWQTMDPARPQADPAPADVLVAQPDAPRVLGALPRVDTGFAPSQPAPGPAFTPRALACDDDGHLYVLDSATQRVFIVDLAQRRVQRAEPVPADAVHLAWHGGWLWVLCASGALLRLAAKRAPQQAGVAAPAGASRLAFAEDGRLFVLLRAHAADAAVLLLGRPGHWLATPQTLAYPGDNPFAFATGLAVSGCGTHQHLVVPRRPEELFTRVTLAPGQAHALAEPLAARHYDGAGIAPTPDGRIVFMTARGPRHATGARLHYHGAGRVIGFRLDAGQPQARWGRILLDACLPPNTSLRLHALINDDDIPGPRAPRTPPANQALAAIPSPQATPLPLQAWLPDAALAGQALFQRVDGSEQPWLVEQEDFATYEAVAPATAGRYLWLVLELQGHSRATPKLRGVRAETPAHDWMRRLPQLYSRHEAMRSFLQRYLTPLAGLEDDLAAQSSQRHALLKPCSTPAAALPWLAHWLGLVLDERWSERARRSFIKEAPWLFRLRGTLWALRRMVEIVTGARVVIVELYRLRGLARVGPVSAAGSSQAWDAPSVLGMGLRVGGPLGSEEITADKQAVSDSFALHAHRFAVLVQAELTPDTEAAVRHLLDQHRPAHTLYTLCALGQGARIGRGLQIGLSTLIGPDSGFGTLQLGAATLGRSQVLGRPARGLRPGTATLGRTSQLG
jgi:phage tail-like protein